MSFECVTNSLLCSFRQIQGISRQAKAIFLEKTPGGYNSVGEIINFLIVEKTDAAKSVTLYFQCANNPANSALLELTSLIVLNDYNNFLNGKVFNLEKNFEISSGLTMLQFPLRLTKEKYLV